MTVFRPSGDPGGLGRDSFCNYATISYETCLRSQLSINHRDRNNRWGSTRFVKKRKVSISTWALRSLNFHQSCRSYSPASDVGRAPFLRCSGKAWFDSPLSNDWRDWLGVKAVYLPRCLWRGLLCGLSYAGRRSFEVWPLRLLLFSALINAIFSTWRVSLIQ